MVRVSVRRPIRLLLIEAAQVSAQKMKLARRRSERQKLFIRWSGPETTRQQPDSQWKGDAKPGPRKASLAAGRTAQCELEFALLFQQ
jgi:hypothetical protein